MTTATSPGVLTDPRPITDLIPSVAAVCRSVLDAAVDREWSMPAGDLEWSCRRTAAHVADVLFSYAGQVVAQPDAAYLPMELVVEDAATPDRLVASVVTCAELLHLACRAAPAGLRAWHPAGVADAEGFAAMGVVEVLVHTHDVDGRDHLALRGGQLVDLREHLTAVEDLDRLTGRRGDEPGVLGLEHGQHRAAVAGAQGGDVGVAQRLVQVRAGAGGAEPARAGEHTHERVLDQILGVMMRAGHAAGGTAQGVDVDRKRLGIELVGHASRLPIWPRSPYRGTPPKRP